MRSSKRSKLDDQEKQQEIKRSNRESKRSKRARKEGGAGGGENLTTPTMKGGDQVAFAPETTYCSQRRSIRAKNRLELFMYSGAITHSGPE